MVPLIGSKFTLNPTVMRLPSVANPLAATFLRGGTSKGVYINSSVLSIPGYEAREQWDPIFLRIMGSPDPQHGRQLNGMGGGVSSLSKLCVVGPTPSNESTRDSDVDYTFAQVGIRDSVVDYSGNCGNLSSMIGVFALDEQMCKPRSLVVGKGAGGEEIMLGTVRSFNNNTNKLIDTTFPVREDDAGNWIPVLDVEQTSIAGVAGKASQITLDFLNPGGARTRKLLPTGNPVDVLTVESHGQKLQVRASLVDATNPTVFIAAEDLTPLLFQGEVSINYAHPGVTNVLELIRQKGAELMGLDPSAQAQPKIAIIGPPRATISTSDVDVDIHALSMGVLHRAVPMTVGLCLGVSSGVKGTLAWEILERRRSAGEHDNGPLLKMRHPSGVVEVGASFNEAGEVLSAKVVRTGRRLMKGVVWW